jgi:hypothetical protein
MSAEEIKEKTPATEQRDRQFKLAMLDYKRLSEQEQALMGKRPEVWPKFIAVVAIPGGYAGVAGLKGAIILLCLVTFFLACLSLDIRHDEQVLRYDVRRSMKRLAAHWGYANYDSQYSDQDGSRWWAGYYKPGRMCAFLLAQVIASSLVSWYFFTTGQLALSVGLGAANLLLTIFTAWCLL